MQSLAVAVKDRNSAFQCKRVAIRLWRPCDQVRFVLQLLCERAFAANQIPQLDALVCDVIKRNPTRSRARVLACTAASVPLLIERASLPLG